MTNLSSVIFDIDGVLLDSLAPHLQICEDKNQEYNLGLTIPSEDEFRKIVLQGVQISPMKYFFLAVGFPERYADLALQDYETSFMENYTPRPFPGVHDLLHAVKEAGFKMGIVTSNVRANVDEAFGKDMMLFEQDCIYTKDSHREMSKSEALTEVCDCLETPHRECLYVGDQPSDWSAAREAGTRFLGVSFGWGIPADETAFPLAHNISDIWDFVKRESANPSDRAPMHHKTALAAN